MGKKKPGNNYLSWMSQIYLTSNYCGEPCYAIHIVQTGPCLNYCSIKRTLKHHFCCQFCGNHLDGRQNNQRSIIIEIMGKSGSVAHHNYVQVNPKNQCRYWLVNVPVMWIKGSCTVCISFVINKWIAQFLLLSHV